LREFAEISHDAVITLMNKALSLGDKRAKVDHFVVFLVRRNKYRLT